jgi:hypothetical protein
LPGLERRIEIVVYDYQQPTFRAEIEDPVQSRIVEAGDFAGDLGGDKFLVNAEFADAGKYPRKGLQHALDVVGGVHVGWVEARNHGIETGLFFPGQ